MQLEQKIKHFHELFAVFNPPSLEVFPCQNSAYRMRAEFGIWHENNAIFYTMRENGKIIKINVLPRVHHNIQNLMQPLLTALQLQENLRHKLFQVEFHCSTLGEMMVSLIYHRPLNEDWKFAANELQKKLQIQIIGRSRGQKIVLQNEFVTEKFTVADRDYFYRQYENVFSQPNAEICAQMLNWVNNQCNNKEYLDLLELYCGNGNFTLPLSRHFRKILATEISKTSIQALRENIELNQINNLYIARLSAEELSIALQGGREFNRLKQACINLQDFQFSTVLVDPPRAGIDDNTLNLLANFDRIIYISCNPITLAANLTILSKTHRIKKLAIFDQFPETAHLEVGTVLEKLKAPMRQ